MEGFLSFQRIVDGPWAAFERAVGRLLYHLDFTDVRLIGGAHDHGGDILALRREERWVFQCKWTGKSPVGETAIQEVLRAAAVYRADRPVVVTNNRLSPAALKYRDQLALGGDLRVDVIEGEPLLQLFEGCDEWPTNRYTPRQYQREAINAVIETLDRGAGRALFVLATGLGKTVVAAESASQLIQRHPEMRVLVLAHVKELVQQLEMAFWRQIPKAVPTHLWTGDEKPTYRDGITFATIDSLHTLGDSLAPGAFQMVVIDEAHHAGASTYQSLLRRIDPPLLLGMTATPWRGDGYNIESIFGPSVFTMGIAEGMRNGFLAEVDYRLMVDDIDWDQVPALSRQGLALGELNRRLFLPQRDQAMLSKIEAHWNELDNPRTIVFCRTIEHAERMAGGLNAAGMGPAACLSDRTQRHERNVLMSRFRDGQVRILTAVDVLNEGVDVPDVSLIVFARVTHSRRIFVQQLGRGLRLTDSKSAVRVLDFVSDIRRVAAGLELQRDYDRAPVRPDQVEILTLPKKIVSFSSPEAETLFNQWIRDVTSLQDDDDQARLDFPPPYAP